MKIKIQPNEHSPVRSILYENNFFEPSCKQTFARMNFRLNEYSPKKNHIDVNFLFEWTFAQMIGYNLSGINLIRDYTPSQHDTDCNFEWSGAFANSANQSTKSAI